MQCSSDCYQRLILESWFQLQTYNKRHWIVVNSTSDLLTESSKTNYDRTTGQLTTWLTINDCLTSIYRRIETHQWHYESLWLMAWRPNWQVTTSVTEMSKTSRMFLSQCLLGLPISHLPSIFPSKMILPQALTSFHNYGQNTSALVLL